jgi:hypothetical protein
MSGFSRRLTTACLAAAVLASATACSPPPSPPPPAAAVPFDTGVSMLELMVHVVQPAAERFWAGSGHIVDGEGEHALRPTTPEGWKSLEDGAMTALEAANLMLLPGRPRAPEADWTRHVAQLRKMAKEAQVAAERQASDDELLDIGGRLYDACLACHEQFTDPQSQQAATP